MTLANIKAPKNGYAFIYISNQSNNDVYFDDLQVGIVQGNIAEENHYYSYGLKIATLSSKKLGDVYEGTLKNNYLYNDKELFDDADLNWYDYGFRNYDPQIGRFTQLDPLTDSYPFLTPYQYASCDPITNIDVDGLEGCPATAGMTGYVGSVGRIAGGAGNIFNGIAAVARIASPIIAGLNLGANIVNTASQQSIVKQQLATNNINGGFTTTGAGNAGNAGHGPNAEQVENPQSQSDPSDHFPFPVFWQEKEYPDIMRIDRLYWDIAPPGVIAIWIGNERFLKFRYESNKVEQDKNTSLAQKANPQCPPNRGDGQQCHEVPYKSTKEGGSGAVMMPANAFENGSHGAKLMWFYKNNKLTDGDYFLVPVGEDPIPIVKPIPVPIPIPNEQTKPGPKQISPNQRKIDGSPILLPLFWYLIEQYWWVIFAI